MQYIFISHSSKDAELASHVANYLERHGLKCWFTPRDVDPTKEWDQAILEAIEACSAILLLFSGNSDDSRHVRREVHLADNARKFLLTLRIEDVQPDKLSYFLNLSQWIDWMDHRDETLEQVYTMLKAIENGEAAASHPPGATPSQNISIPEGQKLWLRTSSKSFEPAPPVPKEKRVLTSDSNSENAMGYLRMRAVSNGRYDSYHKIIRPDGSVYGYFTDGFSQLAYTWNFVSPENDDCIYVLNCKYQAKVDSLSILRRTGWLWTKLGAAKFGVSVHHSLAFNMSTYKVTEFNFRGNNGRELFCMNSAGFFLFDTGMKKFLSNAKFGDEAAASYNPSISPTAPLVAVTTLAFKRKSMLDNRDIYQSRIEIYDIETGDRVMAFQLPGEEYSIWNITFSKDGKMLRATLDAEEHLFDLIEVGY